MKPLRPSITIGLVLALLAAGGFLVMKGRQTAPAQAAASEAPAAKAAPILELASNEVLTVVERTLQQTVPVSGTLKAVKTAAVKIRVAGEVQGLMVREGDFVKAGQIIARIEPTEVKARLRQAKEQTDTAKSQVDIAQRQFDNNQSLVQQGFISKTALENAVASLNGAKGSYQASLAAVEIAQRALEDTVLRAPISGFVATRGVQNGERAPVEAKVIDIVDLSSMELEAVLPPQDALALRVGQVAQLRLDGASQTTLLAAKVVRINPSAQSGSRGVVVYLSVPAHPLLKNGLFAQGEVQIGQVQALALPLDGLRTDKPSPYVQVIDGAKIRHQNVAPGLRGQVGSTTMVAVQGLSTGDRVVAGSVGPLREGTAVKLLAASVPAVAPVNAPASVGK